MEDFATLGWMEYATLGAHHPGGWTEEEGIYCVKKAYDVNSENFKISYLTHEARHFADKKLWPDLKSADLEYRAKLTELNLAQDTLLRFNCLFCQKCEPRKAKTVTKSPTIVLSGICPKNCSNRILRLLA